MPPSIDGSLPQTLASNPLGRPDWNCTVVNPVTPDAFRTLPMPCVEPTPLVVTSQ